MINHKSNEDILEVTYVIICACSVASVLYSSIKYKCVLDMWL